MIWSEEELNRYGFPEDDDDTKVSIPRLKYVIILFIAVIVMLVCIAYLLK